jgi:hypothetical protein
MMDRAIRWRWISVSFALWLGCGGGGQSSRSSEPAPTPAPAQTTAQPTPAPAPAPEPQHTYYQLFWREIHIATIYIGPGPLRSEEPNNPAVVMGGHCAYMSVISHYFEHEAQLYQLIQQADSLDAFFALLAQDPNYRLEQAYLEEGY